MAHAMMPTATALNRLKICASIALALLLAVIARLIWNNVRRNLILRRQLDGPSDSLLLGVASHKDFNQRRHKLIEAWVATYGSVFFIRIAWMSWVVITDPAVVKEVVHRRDLDKSKMVYAPVSLMMSRDGHMDLVTSLTNAKWRFYRKALAPAFNPVNIRNGFRHISAASDELIAILRAGGSHKVWDMHQAALSETMDVIAQFGFGFDVKALKGFAKGEQSELSDVLKEAQMEVERRLTDPLRQYVGWLTAGGRRGITSFKRFQDLMFGVLQDTKARFGREPPESDGSLAALLMRLRDPDSGAPISDAELLPHIGMLFFAGFETTGNTITWTLYHISQHPDVEAKIVDELRGIGLPIGKDATEPSARRLAFEDLSQLPYLASVIKESMRMSSVAGTTTLRVNDSKDITLSNGLRVPAGTPIWVPLCGIQNSEANWGSNFAEFRPDRWEEEDAEYHVPGSVRGQSDRERGASLGKKNTRDFESDLTHTSTNAEGETKFRRFMPFSDGRRNCIGQSLAKMNITAALATLLANFHFELDPQMGGQEGVKAAEVMSMTLMPSTGMMMTAHSRESM